MELTEGELQEGKRLKKKRLIQSNLLMLLLFGLLAYLVEKEALYILIVSACVMFWFFTVLTLYALKTGKSIGTKTIRLAYDFDRRKMGEKRWKRKTITEAVLLIAASIIFTVSLFTIDFDAAQMNLFSVAIPFIASWVGFNIGELVRISDL